MLGSLFRSFGALLLLLLERESLSLMSTKRFIPAVAPHYTLRRSMEVASQRGTDRAYVGEPFNINKNMVSGLSSAVNVMYKFSRPHTIKVEVQLTTLYLSLTLIE
jgi:hypothetical protein